MKIVTTRGTEIEVEFVGIGAYSSAIVRLEIPKRGLRQKDAKFFPNTAGIPYIEFQYQGKTGKMEKGKCEITQEDSEKLKVLFRAAVTEKEAVEKARREEEKQAILTGKKAIKLAYHDGEYLSGWEVLTDHAAGLLEEIGVAKYVSSWGYLVDRNAFAALGKSFTFLEAVEYMRPAKEAAKKKAAEQQQKKEAAKKKAFETGKRIEISHYATECDDANEECNLDIITKWVMPNGTVETTRSHTW